MLPLCNFFFNSSRLGDQYSYNIFVGDISNGNLYFLKVEDNRTGLVQSPLFNVTLPENNIFGAPAGPDKSCIGWVVGFNEASSSWGSCC
jgi:hypothetical protein